MAKKSFYLYGKNSVLERLKESPETIRKVYIQDNFKSPETLNAVKIHNIPLTVLNEKELRRIKKADRLQGIIAETDRYQYTSFDYLLKTSAEKNITFIFLDGLNDPHNLGSILRIAGCFGNFAVVIPEHGSCEVNETVLHVASGAENFVSVSRVTNLSKALTKAKESGYWAVGAVVDGGENLNDLTLPFPLCLVLGAEGRGIRPGILKHIDLKVSLPMKGAQLSFNVAMACAIFAHEITKQRKI